MWQFTHDTGKEFLKIDYIIDERRDPIISAWAAAKFLKRNYQQLGTWPLALTAYNYGPSGMRRALNQEGSYERIFRNYSKGHFKFASRNFYSEFLAAVKVAKRLERSGLVLEQPLRAVTVKLPAYTRAENLCEYLGISTELLKKYNPALRDPVFKGSKYIPKGYVLKLPYRFNNSRLLSAAPPSIFSSAQKRSRFYRVKPGDSAGTIAHRHKVSLESLIRANNLNKKAVIRVGQNLRIPSPDGTAVDIAASTATSGGATVLRDNKKLPPSGISQPVYEQNLAVFGNLKVFDQHRRTNLLVGTIEVQPDESIGLLADWLKVTPVSIRVSNNLPKDSDAHPGQKIKLDFINTSVSSFEENRFDFHQELQEDFFNSFLVVGFTDYRVQNGDTIWDICRNKFDVPLWLLKKYNTSLDYTRLEQSSRLQIPILRKI
jgi:membrane-bound lytic murein transglycosylase D